MAVEPYADKFTFVGDGVWLSEFRLLASHPDWHATRRTSDDCVLIAFPRTTVAIRHDNRPEIVADPLSAVVYGPGQEYRRRLVDGRGDDCMILAVSEDLVRASGARLVGGRDAAVLRFPFSAAPVDRSAQRMVEKIRRSVPATTHEEAERIQEELYWLVQHVLDAGRGARSLDGTSASRAHTELANSIREELGRDLEQTASLKDLSMRLAVSPFHLVRVFRSVTGRPIHAYRTELRLRSSLPLIADGVPLADVAQQLGFASHSHLTDRFVRAYGLTPSRWRETSKNMEAMAPRGT